MEEMKVALGECSVVPRGKSIRRFQRGSTDGFDPNRYYVPGVLPEYWNIAGARFIGDAL